MTAAQTVPSPDTTAPDAPAAYVHQGMVPVEYAVGSNSDPEISDKIEMAMQEFKQRHNVGLIFDLQRFRDAGPGTTTRNVRLEITFSYVRVEDLQAYATALQSLSPSLLLRLLVGS